MIFLKKGCPPENSVFCLLFVLFHRCSSVFFSVHSILISLNRALIRRNWLHWLLTLYILVRSLTIVQLYHIFCANGRTGAWRCITTALYLTSSEIKIYSLIIGIQRIINKQKYLQQWAGLQRVRQVSSWCTAGLIRSAVAVTRSAVGPHHQQYRPEKKRKITINCQCA
jgi:hypothetical protein